MVRLRHGRVRSSAIACGILLACGCSGTAAVRPQGNPAAPHAVATLQELMEGQIDPAADALWDSVAYIASASGVEDRQPRSDADWAAVRREALVLIEAANLLTVPGRSVRHGTEAARPGELNTGQIQALIEARRQEFFTLAGVLQRAGLGALAAIEARDAAGLMEAGGRIDAACEACHLIYWYPNQRSAGS